jgi:UDP-3-O-[3-hydroxymyristoyl] glucosamine N-acyltransferase
MKFSVIVEKLTDETVGGSSLTTDPDCNPDVRGVASVAEARSGMLSYVEGGRYKAMVAQTEASVLLLPLDEELQQIARDRGIAWIATQDPKLLFTKAVRLFYQPYRLKPGIHPTAVIDPSVILGKDCAIGPRATIEANVKIGDNVCIFANVAIYPDVEIGDRTTLHANCTIHERARIGSDCVIHSGAVIGAEGFGFVPSPQGWVKLEQAGIAVLEDGVEIGCNSTVDRPAMGETRIGRNTKIDNLVQIGHGCKIGANCVMSAQVGLAGRVKVGDGAILAGQVGVTNDVTIGAGAIASAKSGLHKDVEAGEVVSGYPAIANKRWLKIAAIYNRLPELYQVIKQLKPKESQNP